MPGISAAQSPDLSGWSQRLEVAQGERADRQLIQTAAQLGKSDPAGPASAKDRTHIANVCKDFESIFIGYLLKTMKESGPKSDFLGKSEAEGIFTEMRDDELAKGMSKAGGIGLAKLMEEQLLRSMAKGPLDEAHSLKKA